MNRTGTRALVETAFLTAINTVITLLGYTVPVFSALIPFIMPVGVAIVGLRNGLRNAILSLLVMFLILSMAIGPQMAFIAAGTFGTLGAAVGQGYYKHWSPAKHMCIPTVLFLFMNLLGMVISVLVMGMNITQIADFVMGPFEAMNQAMLESGASNPEALAQWQQMWAMMQVLIKQAFFAILFGSSAVSTFVAMKVTTFIYKRVAQVQLPSLPNFEDWRMPLWTLYVFLLGIIGNYWLSQWGLAEWTWISMHMTVLGVLFCVLNGMSTIYSVARTYGLSRVVGYILVIALYLMVGYGVVLLGMIDMIFDLRGRLKRRS